MKLPVGTTCVECDQPATQKMDPMGPLCDTHWKAQCDVNREWMQAPIVDAEDSTGEALRIGFHGAGDGDIDTDGDGANIRYVVTHIATNGLRTMTWPRQGRYTHATPGEAEEAMAALLDVAVNQNDIPGVYGEQAVGTFEVRPVECYPGHHDPKTRYFEE